MTDETLNKPKVQRPRLISPKYAMNKGELKALRAEWQARIDRLEDAIREDSDLSARNAIRFHQIAEAKLQIKLIDNLL